MAYLLEIVPPDKELYRFVLGKLTWALTGRLCFFVMATKVKPNIVKILKYICIRMRNSFLYNLHIFKKIIALTIK